MCIFMRARRLTQPWKCYLGPPGASWTGTPFWRGWLRARQYATAPRGGWRNLGKRSGSSKRSMTMSAVGRSCCQASTMMRWCKSASCLSTLQRHSKATTGASTSAFAVTTPSWTSGALSSWLRSMSRGGTKSESRTKPMVQSGRLSTKSYCAWFTSTTMHMLRTRVSHGTALIAMTSTGATTTQLSSTRAWPSESSTASWWQKMWQKCEVMQWCHADKYLRTQSPQPGTVQIHVLCFCSRKDVNSSTLTFGTELLCDRRPVLTPNACCVMPGKHRGGGPTSPRARRHCSRVWALNSSVPVKASVRQMFGCRKRFL